MDLSLTHFIGIDLNAPRGSLSLAILDGSKRILFRGCLPISDLPSKLTTSPVVIAAITSPITLNEGLMADEENRAALSTPPAKNRYSNLRACEYELILRGFSTPRTPSVYDDCSPALKRALRFSSQLAALGFQRWPTPGSERQLMEVHPDGAFAALLGNKLNSAASLEGRIQRQLLLQEEHVNVRDPMTFFEEVTRHRMLTGNLPEGIVLSVSELNALVAAFTAWSGYTNPTEVARLGDANEGRIILPVSTRNR